MPAISRGDALMRDVARRQKWGRGSRREMYRERRETMHRVPCLLARRMKV